MEAIQIVLDGDPLGAADRAARKLKTNRSALFRDALKAYLKHLDIREREERDREGYIRYPDSLEDPAV